MPKVEYTAAKGLFQSSGSGIEFNGNTVQGNLKKVITHSASSGDLTLTAADTGAIIKVTGNASGQVINLPAVADAAGMHFDLVVNSQWATHNLVVMASGAENQILIAQDHTSNNVTRSTGDDITINAGQEEIGDRCAWRCDGAKWYATSFASSATCFSAA